MITLVISKWFVFFFAILWAINYYPEVKVGFMMILDDVLVVIGG